SRVAEQAGRELKKTVLELGGSDPFVVLEDADVAAAARTAAEARLINNGQSCIAAKRFIVVDAVAEPFLDLFVAEMRSRRMGDPLSPETQVGPQARHDLRDDLHRQVEESVRRGAEVVLGGRVPEAPGAFYPPTVLVAVRRGMPAFDEETFGPVAALIRARVGADASALAAGALVMRVYEFAGDVLSLGRYHLLPPGRPGTRVRLHRRHSGGRATVFGDGFVGLALTLPHRSALVSAEPLALAPDQVMNRCVRGILEGLKAAGVAAFYPGRDLITVDRRPLGLVTFEVSPTGVRLFVGVLAHRRDFGLLPAFLDELDPDGVVSAEMLTADGTTSLGRLGAT